jgi:integrase
VDLNLITSNPAARLPKVEVHHDQKQPFTSDEMKQILSSVHAENLDWDDLKRYKVRALVLLMRWSGLAIMDATTLERGALDSKDRVVCQRNKTGQHIYVRLPKYVADLLRGLPAESPYFFWNGSSQKTSMVNRAGEWLAELFTEAQVKGTSHKFRHTFAVGLLQKGVPIEDVSKLLGHKSLAVTERHYSAWVPARQKRLDEVVQSGWD